MSRILAEAICGIRDSRQWGSLLSLVVWWLSANMNRESKSVCVEIVGNVPKQVRKLALPFAVPAEDQIRAFTKEVEMAAILYLAEADRRTGDGHILKKPDEKLVFIAEACYPIWLVPWNGATLLFDGLGVTTHTLSYDTLPDVDAFNGDIQASARTCEAYAAALSRNANYFQTFAGKTEETIEGLITDPDFIQDFWVYLLEVEEAETPLATKAVVSPIINASDISALVKELADLRTKIEKDARDLEVSMKLLTVLTRRKTRAIRAEIKRIRRKFDQEIKQIKPKVTKKKQQIQKKYDTTINKYSKKCDERLRLLQKDRSRLQKAKKKAPNAKKRIKAIDRKVARIETTKKLKLSQQRTTRDRRIEEATKPLRELEASRDASLGTKQREKTLLADLTSSILDQMNGIIESKRTALHEFYKISMDAYGISRPQKNACALVYLPLYLVRYETESKKRYAVYPPSIVGSIGILTKVKEVLGATRMGSFLQPYSKAITSLLNRLVPLIEKNPVLEKEISDAAIRASILRATELRLGVNRGLRELRGEKWLSESDRQTLSKLLYTYAL
jgi:uncharacterized protein with PIN domain